MNLKDIYVSDTLNNLKCMDYVDIQIILNIIAGFTRNSEFPIYPFCEMVDDGTGRRVSKIKSPSLKDGEHVAYVIISKLLSFSQREVSRLRKDGVSVYDLEKEEFQNNLLKRLDNEYSFLEKVPVYNSIYTSFRNDYIKLIIKIFRQVESRVMLHKHESIESQFNYTRTVKASKAFQKIINNKPQRKSQF